MGNLLQDLRYGFRNLRRDRGFVIVAMLTLALGIGANTTIFSVMNNTLLKPIPFPGADRLVLVWETFGKGSDNWNIVSAPNFWDFQKRSRSFESMAIFDSAGRGYNLSPTSNSQEAEQVSGLRVSAGFFSVLGAKPLLGRTFLPEEETLGNDHKVVLSYGLWQSRYGGDPSLVGKTIRVDSAPFTVVGVTIKKGQSSSGQDYDDAAFIPISTFQNQIQGGLQKYIAGIILVSAVSADDTVRAQAEIAGLLRDRHHLNGVDDDDFNIRNLTEIANAQQQGTQALTALLAAIAVVSLVVGGIGIMNIMLVSVTERTREIGVRMAVGAKPWQILAQFLAEAVTLSMLGGLVGVVLGSVIARVVAARLGWGYSPRVDMIALSFGFSALVGVGFGLYPARKAARLDPIEALRYE